MANLSSNQREIPMRLDLKNSLSLLASVALIGAAMPALAQTTSSIPVGRSSTPTPTPIPVTPTPAPSTNIAQAIAQSTDHTTLQKLIVEASLTGALSAPGPITLFAPDDAAFGRLAPGTVDTLLQPEHVWSVEQILKYHVVSGSYDTADLLKALKAGGNTLTLNTLDGQPLTLTLAPSGAIMLTDATGGTAYISKASDSESNGAIEYINSVLSPKMMAKPPAGAAPAASPPAATPDTSGTAAPATQTGG
jgi:uncharacterized surface protein with fasciclin (FAS1) repeats